MMRPSPAAKLKLPTLAIPGSVDSGGQNVYVGQLAKNLATLGYDVDVFTRRDSDRLPEIAEWVSGIRIIHVPAGPPCGEKPAFGRRARQGMTEMLQLIVLLYAGPSGLDGLRAYEARVMPICREVAPAVINLGGTHHVTCHLYDDAVSPNGHKPASAE